MRMKLNLSATAIAAALLGLAGCTAVQDAAAPNTLVAVKAAGAPNMDAGAE